MSKPGSPFIGMVWKTHTRLPVRTSKPRMKPLTLFLLFGKPPSRCAAPTTMMSFAMIGAEWRPISAVDEIEAFLIEAQLQIDDAIGAEARHALAGLRVERDHLVAGRDVDDALFLAVAPVGEAAARQQARRGFTALAFVDAVHPQHLAGRRVERDGAIGGCRRS